MKDIKVGFWAGLGFIAAMALIGLVISLWGRLGGAGGG